MRRLAVLLLLVLPASPAAGQAGRAALMAGTERYLLADYQGAVPLLSLGLDPRAGPLDELWLRGVERLADVLLVLRQDSSAATWLRWATRLAPQFEVDQDVMPPAVALAARAARAFVGSTPNDRFVSQARFEWPTSFRAGAFGTVRLASAVIPITARIGADQFLRGGEVRGLPVGSYAVVVSAPGYLPTRLTVEVLPGVTTVVDVSLLPETSGALYVAARPWGTIFVDDQRIGYTSVAGHRIAPGSHKLRLEREGAPTEDTTLVVPDRGQVRLAWVSLPERTSDAALDNGLGLLDRAEMELGITALERWLAELGTARQPERAVALARLAEVKWASGSKDSAGAYLQALVEADPFYRPLPNLFNPELLAVYASVRRQTAVIAIRAPADTVMTPLTDALPVEVAVGRPGEVRLVLRITSPRSRDSVLTALWVDSVATAQVKLSAPDSGALGPGTYAIEGEVVFAGGTASDLLQLTVGRLAVDTVPHEPPIPSTWFQPESRKGVTSLRSALEGLGLAALAVTASTMANDGNLSGRAVPLGGVLVGGVVAVAYIGGKSPRVLIPRNREYNESLRAEWEGRNRGIAAENVRRLRLAPLRIRTSREP